MVSEATRAVALPSVAVQTGLSAAEKRRRWFELALVLLVAFAGPLFSAVYSLISGTTPTSLLSLNARWAYDSIQESTALLLLAYTLWRRGLGFKSLGLFWRLRDILIAVPLVIVSYAADRLSYRWIYYASLFLFLSRPSYRPASSFFGHPGWFGIAFALFNPFFEELIVRAYLMTEIIELTGSKALAVIASTTLQAAYHLYYGWAAALAIAFQFLILSLYYARWRRALPLIAAHAFFDVYATVRLMR